MNGSWFEIGQQLTIPTPGTGASSCQMEDITGMYGDDQGEVVVRVVVTK